PPYAPPRTASTTSAPASAHTPAAAPISTSAIQDAETTWRAACPESSPVRVSGTDVTRPSENAVTVTSPAAARYAYPKLVTAPVPSRPANGRQTTYSIWSAIGSTAAAAKTPSRARIGNPAGRAAAAGMRALTARTARLVAGTRRATVAFNAIPQATTMIPSEST